MQENDSIARIYSLSLKNNDQESTEEETFSITRSELQALLKPLEDRIKELEDNQDSLYKNQDIFFEWFTSLRKKNEDRQIDIERADKIAKYIHDRPDHKSSFETLKGHFKIGDARLTGALTILEKNYPGVFMKVKDTHDKRKRWLVEIPITSSKCFPGK